MNLKYVELDLTISIQYLGKFKTYWRIQKVIWINEKNTPYLKIRYCEDV